jgi:hypothetical protein
MALIAPRATENIHKPVFSLVVDNRMDPFAPMENFFTQGAGISPGFILQRQVRIVPFFCFPFLGRLVFGGLTA